MLRKRAAFPRQIGRVFGIAMIEFTAKGVDHMELGETAPDIKQAQILSQVFGVSLDELTGNDTKEVIYEKVSNTERLAGVTITILKTLGIFIITFILISVIIFTIGIISFTNTHEEGTVEQVTITEDVGDETYVIELGSDGYINITGPSEEIKEDITELIVVGDFYASEANITEYFIKLREGLQQSP